MRILYDGAIYSLQAFGGISRYFADIISRLAPGHTPIILSATKRPFPPHPNLQVHCREFSWWPKPFKRLNRLAKRRYFNALHSSLDVDILHPTYYSLLVTDPPKSRRFPTVLTIYDCIHERFASLIDADGSHARLKRAAIERADSFICISEHTKRDFLELYQVPESKVSVIHLATGIGDVPPAEAFEIPDRPYFLYVGSRHSYKNFDRLLQATSNVRQNHSETMLHVVGEPFSPAESQRIAALGMGPHVKNWGGASDAVLKRLYQHSVAFVYPSLYEGFGIPPLEAMICGTAVVASNTSSIPEVVGDAGLLVAPESTGDLTNALRSLLDKPSLRNELVAKGRKQAARFSWDRAVKEHLKVYERAA